MKIVNVSYRYTERRSEAFQTVESSVEVQAQVEAGEKGVGVLTALRDQTRRMVRYDVEHSLSEVLGRKIERRPVVKHKPAVAPKVVTNVAAAATSPAPSENATVETASAPGQWGTPGKK